MSQRELIELELEQNREAKGLKSSIKSEKPLNDEAVVEGEELPREQVEMKSTQNDPVDVEDTEGDKWMKRYKEKVFEGKVYKLKQNLNLVLKDMQ